MSSPFTPQHSPRQVAMLKAMGVGVWWHPVAEDEAAPITLTPAQPRPASEQMAAPPVQVATVPTCLLYTSDAADE